MTALVAGAVALFHDGASRPMAIPMFVTMAASALAFRGMALPRRTRAMPADRAPESFFA
jgi:hypothetical protein